MARRGEIPVEIVSLDDMLKKLHERHDQHLASMAVGRSELEYRELVGRAKECKALIEACERRVQKFRQEGE